MVDKFVKLVVGYFVYGSARNTAMGIDVGAKYIWSPEPYEYRPIPTNHKIRIM